MVRAAPESSLVGAQLALPCFLNFCTAVTRLSCELIHCVDPGLALAVFLRSASILFVVPYPAGPAIS
jgi:hypothetical protein